MVLIHSIRHLYNYQFAPSPIYSGTDQDPYSSSVESQDERVIRLNLYSLTLFTL